MSTKSILESFISWVANFINHILPDSKHLLNIAQVVVNGMKNFVDSGAADVIAALIPGTVDDAILAKIRRVLPVILVDLKLAEDEVSKTCDEIVKDGINAIQSMPDNARSVTLQGIWQLLSNELTDNSINLPSLQKIGQAYYEETKAIA